MWKIAPWFCAGLIIGLALVSMSGDRLTAQPIEFSRYTSPACAYSNGGSFICVADLDGNGQKEIIVGQNNAFSPNINTSGLTMSYVNIINNTGSLRQQVCWLGTQSNPATASASCPPIIATAN